MFGDGAIRPRDYADGYEYLYDKTLLLKRLVTLGLYTRPWQTAQYEENRSISNSLACQVMRSASV
jgi:hypothetical protein